MKTKSDYSTPRLYLDQYQLKKIKHEIQYLRTQLLEIDQQVEQIKQNFPNLELEQAKPNTQELSDNNSQTEDSEENT